MKTTRKSTMVEFVEELQKLPDSPGLREMIEEARAGEYHDYKNRKYYCGKMAASGKLRALGHIDLAKRIESGEFDEEADDIDKAHLRKDIDENCAPGEAAAMKRMLGL